MQQACSRFVPGATQAWIPPSVGCVKVNTDSSFILGEGGAGMVTRDYHGKMLGVAVVSLRG